MDNHYVYVLTNPWFKDDVVKIGYTRCDVKSRVNSLFNTSIPTKFNIEFVIVTTDGISVERKIHKHLNYCRINSGREFFQISLDELKKVIVDELKFEIYSPDDDFDSKYQEINNEVCEDETEDNLDDQSVDEIKPQNDSKSTIGSLKHYCKCCDYQAKQR
jgi:hypothetical protein